MDQLSGSGPDLIAPGSITGSNIALGAIGAAQLAKPPRSGTILSSSLDFEFRGAAFGALFSPPCSTTPIVTLGMESSDATQTESTLFLTNTTPTGFAGAWIPPVANAAVTSVWSNRAWPSTFAVVNGCPALVYDDSSNGEGVQTNLIMYVRANDASGSSWGTPVPVSFNTNDSFWFGDVTLAVVDGHPAIVWEEEVSDEDTVVYARANDATGSSWGAPVALHSSSNLWINAFNMIGGRPAVLWTEPQPDLDDVDETKYIRSNDATGSSWPSPVSLGTNIYGVSLAEVDGRPAVACHESDNSDSIQFILANDANGLSWDSPVAVDGAGYDPRLVVIDGRPAIVFSDTGGLGCMYARANDGLGSAWGEPILVDPGSGGLYWMDAQLGVAGGRPVIVHVSQANNTIYIGAKDSAGAAWWAPLDIGNGYPSLLMDVQGKPVILASHYDDYSGFIILESIRPKIPAPFTIHWMALEP